MGEVATAARPAAVIRRRPALDGMRAIAVASRISATAPAPMIVAPA